ncbi:hypothetical protein [Helicobacter canadensis]|uniref:Uncharacterized protein n=1 Tax=Helicobacter canadensis MIT 98-5491 TaxID=537970 RepID=C5ZV77_9HELI|nr:hypothetical protein [Helicobacter canadensis]EES88736.1 hypothetical protein HCAN_0011 [Helicobacter canadensis MIT 98-5491]STP00001.1 Uncharacterised protein [Helicobacter canadensis]
MAFKINTLVSLTPKEPQKPQTTNPPKPQENQQTSTQNSNPIKKPLGNLDSTLPQSSNSAFSSLFLSQKDWLQKEFGITDETIKDLLEESQQENYLADFLWKFQKL